MLPSKVAIFQQVCWKEFCRALYVDVVAKLPGVSHMHMQATAEEDPDEQALIAQVQEKVSTPSYHSTVRTAAGRVCSFSLLSLSHWVLFQPAVTESLGAFDAHRSRRLGSVRGRMPPKQQQPYTL